MVVCCVLVICVDFYVVCNEFVGIVCVFFGLLLLSGMNVMIFRLCFDNVGSWNGFDSMFSCCMLMLCRICDLIFVMCLLWCVVLVGICGVLLCRL